MPVGGRLRLIKGVLYRLKRTYGCPLTVYKQSTEITDLQTGRSSINRISVDIKQALVLPSKSHRGSIFGADFTRANPGFQQGAVFTDSLRIVVIDRKDLPFALDATDTYYIVYDNERWEIKEVENFEFDLAYSLTLAKVDGAIPNKIINIRLNDRLYFNELLSDVSPTEQLEIVTDNLLFAQTITHSAIIHNQNLYDSLTFSEVTYESRT